MTKKFDRTNYIPKHNAADLKEKVSAYVERIANLTDDALRSEAIQDYFATVSRFHRYSLNNAMLILLANPGATLVAGYHDWMNKFGRFVRKGESGMPILAPVIVPDEEKSKETGRKITKLVGFKVVYVFDVSQTDGNPLPETPEWKSLEKRAELDAAATAYAKDLEIEVQVHEIAGGAQGSSSMGTIELAPAAGTKTIFHELAHELLHDGWARFSMSHAAKEMEAEATAWIVSQHFNLDAVGSPNYIALSGATGDLVRKHLEAITNAASAIIDGIESHLL